MKSREILFATSLGILALVGTGFFLRYCQRRVMHVDENEFITHVCDNAVDKPTTPQLAQALLGTTTERIDENEQAWLRCLAEIGKTCPSPVSFKMDHGIFSALPRRYWVDVDVENGIVKKCNVSSAPGW